MDDDAPRKKDRNYHRPISITIEHVAPVPMERTLPTETQMTINLKGDEKTGKLLIAEIRKQIKAVGHFAVEVGGPS